MHNQSESHTSASHFSFLAIDTAFDICSIALTTPEYSDYRVSESPRKHADEVLPMIDNLLSTHHLQIASLDFLAMISGPGSFTGLRIGTAVVQGLAFGANLPVVCVSSLALMARSARQKSEAGKIILTCLHAREAEFYFAAYRDELDKAPAALLADTIFTPQQIKQSFADLLLSTASPNDTHIVLAGPGWQHELLAELASNPDFETVCVAVDAKLLAELAAQDFLAGKMQDAADATPAYLKEDMEYRTV